MKLVILGATGKTGTALLSQALEAGHEVTALTRSATAVTVQSPRLRVVEANVFRTGDLENALEGQDAMVSALGPRGYGKTTIYSETIRHMVEAMRSRQVKRLLCISSAGQAHGDPAFGLFYKVFFRGILLRNMYADMARMEAYLREITDVEWIVVRPTELTDGPLTGRYRVSPKYCPPGKRSRISRQDVAHFMLRQLSAGDYVRGTPTLAY